MVNNLISQIELIIQKYGATGIFVSGFLEEIIAPIPSSLIPMSAGFFMLSNYSFKEALILSFLMIALPMTFGVIIGSLFLYFFAYYGGKPLILKYGKFLGLNWDMIEKINEKFKKFYFDELFLFILRIFPLIPNAGISVFCGFIRYPLVKFVVISFMGIFVRSWIMAIIGWKAQELYVIYLQKIEEIFLFFFLVLFFVVILAVIAKKYLSKIIR